MIRPSMNSVVMTYELAEKEEYKYIMTATSNITGKSVNRFYHLHQNLEDFGKESEDAKIIGAKDSCLLSTLCGNGRLQCHFLYNL